MLPSLYTFTKVISNLFLLIIITLAGVFVASHFNLINFYKPFIVTSGSMEPVIKTGSVVLVKSKPFGYMVGDVITFKLGKNTTTHRVKSLQMRDGQLVYQTQGDANSDPDSNLVTADSIIGHAQYSVPYIGYAANFAQTPQGFILLVIVPATIVIYEELKNIFKELKAYISKLAKSKRKSSPSTSQIHSISESLDSEPLNSTDYDFDNNSKFKFHFKLTLPQIILPDFNNPSYRFIMLPIVAGLFVTIAATNAFFTDTDTSSANILGASDNYGEQLATIYNTASNNCTEGATDTSTPVGKLLVKLVDGNLKINTHLSGAPANATYDLYIHQEPGACPLGSATQLSFITTDGSGNASATFINSHLDGTTHIWITLVNNDNILSSTSVTLTP